MPEYERAVLRQNTGMDNLNFTQEELLIMEGTTFVDFPLHQIMSEHYLTRASLTSVVREHNLQVKPPVQNAEEDHEIICYTELPANRSVPNDNLKRLVMKTDSAIVKDIKVKLKRSLTRKCQNITIRTDLQTMGIYLMKHWLLKYMCEYEQGEKAIEFTNFGTEFVSFIAQNQFK